MRVDTYILHYDCGWVSLYAPVGRVYASSLRGGPVRFRRVGAYSMETEPVVYTTYLTCICPCGGIGRHSGFKIRRRNPSRFEFGLGHQSQSIRTDSNKTENQRGIIPNIPRRKGVLLGHHQGGGPPLSFSSSFLAALPCSPELRGRANTNLAQ